jgi:hypothetical protein
MQNPSHVFPYLDVFLRRDGDDGRTRGSVRMDRRDMFLAKYRLFCPFARNSRERVFLPSVNLFSTRVSALDNVVKGGQALVQVVCLWILVELWCSGILWCYQGT